MNLSDALSTWGLCLVALLPSVLVMWIVDAKSNDADRAVCFTTWIVLSVAVLIWSWCTTPGSRLDKFLGLASGFVVMLLAVVALIVLSSIWGRIVGQRSDDVADLQPRLTPATRRTLPPGVTNAIGG